ncbi:MAG: cysteine hydrolase [Pontiella sp.]
MKLNKRTTAIVFIEFQKEWLDPKAKLRRLLVQDDHDFQQATAHAEQILHQARTQGWRVVHAGMDLTADPEYLLFNGGQKVQGLRAAIPHASTWTGDQAAFAKPFIPEAGEYIVQGRSGASVLKNSTLDPYLRNTGITTLILLGFALHVCVESSLREAHDIGYNVMVPTDACGVFEPAQRTYVEQHVIHHFGTQINTTNLLSLLGDESCFS